MFLLKTINYKLSTRPAFSLIEVVLSVALFAMLVTSMFGAYIYSQESVSLAGARNRASLIAEEGLEATRSIRDASFGSLVDGTYGLTQSGNKWILSGSSDTTDIFQRQVTISSIDANRKQIVSSVNWNQNMTRTGNISLTSYLDNWSAATIKRKNGLLVYGDGGTTSDAIKYQTFDATVGSWSAPADTVDVDSATTNRALRAAKVYSSASRSEKILVSRHFNGTNQSIYAQVYNGTAWGNLVALSNWNNNTFLDVQNFDGTYLSDGTFMVVYSDNTAIPKARIWNGTSWLTQTSLTTLGTGQIPNYIIAKTRPGTNEVIAAFFTQGLDTITQYFNGSTWSAITTHATTAPVNTKRLIDFDWSPQDTTKGALVYTNSSNSRAIQMKIWTANGSGSGAWSSVRASGNQGSSTTREGQLTVTGRSGANEFLTCAENTVSQVICYKTDFTPIFSNPINQIIAPTTDTGLQRSYHIATELSGAIGLSVYSDATNIPKLKIYTSATSAFDATATNMSALGGVVKSVRMIPASDSDDIMIMTADANKDLWTSVWNGANNSIYPTGNGFGFTAHGTNGSASTDYWYDFIWDRN